jgi:ribonucleoside-diphosphate reductase alpha chain
MAKKEDKSADAPATAVAAAPVATTPEAVAEKYVVRGAVRRELPKVRNSKTFSFTVSDSHGYMTIGEYDDGTPGEVFMRLGKQGSTLAGFIDAFAISVSHGLQFGVPLKDYVKSFTSMTFAPSGITDDAEIRTASSLVDYMFRRLALSYLSFDDRLELGLASFDDMPDHQTTLELAEVPIEQKLVTDPVEEPAQPVAEMVQQPAATSASAVKEVTKDAAAPLCYNCGNQTQRSGSCYVCTSCGSTTGCS